MMRFLVDGSLTLVEASDGARKEGSVRPSWGYILLEKGGLRALS